MEDYENQEEIAMITGVVHSGIAVKSLDVSIPFYRDVLGLKPREREEVRRSRGDKLAVPGAVIQTCVIEIPGSEATIELIEYKEPASMFNYGCPVNTPGQVHIAFRVDDIEAEIERLKKYNVAFCSDSYETIKDGPIAGWKWIFLKIRTAPTLN